MEKKPWEKSGSVGGVVLLWPDEPAVFAEYSSGSQETTDVLSVWTSTRCPLRSGRKCFSARNMASISRQFMCHVRWWPSLRPWAVWPHLTAPRPRRKASIVSVMRQQGAPNIGPWDRNQGFFHMSKEVVNNHRFATHYRAVEEFLPGHEKVLGNMCIDMTLCYLFCINDCSNYSVWDWYGVAI